MIHLGSDPILGFNPCETSPRPIPLPGSSRGDLRYTKGYGLSPVGKLAFFEEKIGRKMRYRFGKPKIVISSLFIILLGLTLFSPLKDRGAFGH